MAKRWRETHLDHRRASVVAGFGGAGAWSGGPGGVVVAVGAAVGGLGARW
jgi:hypothetical protein